MRKLIGVVSVVLSLGVSACSPGVDAALHKSLTSALNTAADASGDAGVLVHVESPRLAEPFAASRPGADGVAISPDTTLRIASNTKTFVAAAALRLVEQGQLDLDAPIEETLPFHLQILLTDGGYDIEAITARMLLQHTAGLPDHAQLQVYFEQILANPQRLWSREEQVALAMSDGDKVGAPGERFAYSDTGYILAAAIIENAHGAPMADAIRALSGMDEIGLEATWWEALELEPETAPARLDQVAFGLPLSGISASVDLFGGGGLISNLEDLARFHRAAASGALFEDEAIAEAMITPSPPSQANGQGGYGMGVFIRAYASETCYEHSGFWGTLAVYCPQTDITVTAAVTNAEEGFAALGPLVDAIVRAAQ